MTKEEAEQNVPLLPVTDTSNSKYFNPQDIS